MAEEGNGDGGCTGKIDCELDIGSSGGSGGDSEPQDTEECSVDHPCITQWTIPDYYNLDPADADYEEFVISGGFILGSFVVDRYGQTYFTGGFTYGTSSILLIPNVAFVGGHIGYPLDQNIPDPLGTSQFLTGFSVNASAGYWPVGVGITVPPGTVTYIPELYGFNRNNSTVAPYSIENGIYTPQASVSITYGFKLPFVWFFGSEP